MGGGDLRRRAHGGVRRVGNAGADGGDARMQATDTAVERGASDLPDVDAVVSAGK